MAAGNRESLRGVIGLELLQYFMYPWNVKQFDAIKSLSAMAHDGRLTLLRRLIQSGPDGVLAGELASFAGIGATTASAQLLVLSNAGLVHSERHGRQVRYFADYENMRGLLSFLMEDCCAKREDICKPVAEACCG